MFALKGWADCQHACCTASDTSSLLFGPQGTLPVSLMRNAAIRELSLVILATAHVTYMPLTGLHQQYQ